MVLRFIHANVYFEKTVDENSTINDIISEYLEKSPEDLRGRTIDKSLETSSSDESDDETETSKPSLVQKPEDVADEIDRDDVITTTLNPFCPPKLRIVESPERDLVVDASLNYEQIPERPLSEEQLREMLLYQSAGVKDIAALLINEDFESSTKYNKFLLNDSLKENLRGLRIVEYPILVVMRKDHAYEFMKENQMETDEIDKIMNKTAETNVAVTKNSMKYFNADSDGDDE